MLVIKINRISETLQSSQKINITKNKTQEFQNTWD